MVKIPPFYCLGVSGIEILPATQQGQNKFFFNILIRCYQPLPSSTSPSETTCGPFIFTPESPPLSPPPWLARPWPAPLFLLSNPEVCVALDSLLLDISAIPVWSKI